MTTDIHAATQAIREALVSGPTPGPWLVKGRVNASGEAIRIESHHPTREHRLYQVCDVLDANGYPRNQANLQFIAACNPEAITAILAALEARDAEIAALREDAERYRWLRKHHSTCKAGDQINPAVARVTFERLYIASIGARPNLDAAIDQARTDGRS